MATAGVTAFPTFRFYRGGNQLDELRGANSKDLEAKVLKHKGAGSFGGSGNALGGWNGVGSKYKDKDCRMLPILFPPLIEFVRSP